MITAVLLAPVCSPVLPSARQVDLRERRLGRARALLALHCADADGLCLGCLDLARLACVPCPLRRTAMSIVETYGVVEWDAPAGGAVPVMGLAQ